MQLSQMFHHLWRLDKDSFSAQRALYHSCSQSNALYYVSSLLRYEGALAPDVYQAALHHPNAGVAAGAWRRGEQSLQQVQNMLADPSTPEVVKHTVFAYRYPELKPFWDTYWGTDAGKEEARLHFLVLDVEFALKVLKHFEGTDDIDNHAVQPSARADVANRVLQDPGSWSVETVLAALVAEGVDVAAACAAIDNVVLDGSYMTLVALEQVAFDYKTPVAVIEKLCVKLRRTSFYSKVSWCEKAQLAPKFTGGLQSALAVEDPDYNWPRMLFFLWQLSTPETRRLLAGELLWCFGYVPYIRDAVLADVPKIAKERGYESVDVWLADTFRLYKDSVQVFWDHCFVQYPTLMVELLGVFVSTTDRPSAAPVSDVVSELNSSQRDELMVIALRKAACAPHGTYADVVAHLQKHVGYANEHLFALTPVQLMGVLSIPSVGLSLGLVAEGMLDLLQQSGSVQQSVTVLSAFAENSQLSVQEILLAQKAAVQA